MKEYGQLLASDAARAPAARFAARTRDVSEFLIELGLPPPQRRLEMRATYHDACHLAHAQNVRSAPRRLLAALTTQPLHEGFDPCALARLRPYVA